jgi:hypothetical protein
VVQLQTNFGGGKTHSMLALYHLFSGIAPTELPASTRSWPPRAPATVPDGPARGAGRQQDFSGQPVDQARWHGGAHPVGRTGLAAWRQEGLRPRAADDEKATSPGDVLRELFNDYGPCLILVDEWVAYARQLHDQSDLPAGGFETNSPLPRC